MRGPLWIYSQKYDIAAKVEDSGQKSSSEPTMDRARLMIQSLLADRFMLKLRKRTKKPPIFKLVVAENGPKFSPEEMASSDTVDTKLRGTPDTPRAEHSPFKNAWGAPISELADRLSVELGCQV